MNNTLKKFSPIVRAEFKKRNFDEDMLTSLLKGSKSSTLLLKVTLHDTNISRYIEILPYSTLYNCAEAIVSAFGFYFDHAFGFYKSIDAEGNVEIKDTRYELFADLDIEDGIKPECPGTYTTLVKQLYKEVGDTWYFLFDYGDEWLFEVSLTELNPKCRGLQYPRLVKKDGKAPKQYPLYKD